MSALKIPFLCHSEKWRNVRAPFILVTVVPTAQHCRVVFMARLCKMATEEYQM